MQRRITDSKKRLIDTIVKSAKSRKSPKSRIDKETYIRQYFRSVAAEDLIERSPEQLKTIALGHLEMANKRSPNQILINVVTPKENDPNRRPDRTIIQTVCEDMAFVIDTVTMVVTDLGLSVYQIIHPILRVKRTKSDVLNHVFGQNETAANIINESFAYFEIDRVGDVDKLNTLKKKLHAALVDVSACNKDWDNMRKKAVSIADELRTTRSAVREKDQSETAALLDWMANDHFTFLGYREYRVSIVDNKPLLKVVPRSGLGILRGTKSSSSQASSPEVQKTIIREMNSKTPLIITKAKARSTVHRPVHMDYIGVKRFDKKGKAVLEQRFLGLFASAAYNRSPTEIPYLRRKIEKVVNSFEFPEHSHSKKALIHILEDFPRDELFQSSLEDLRRISDGVLGLQERQRVKVFIRRDPYQRFISCMIYVPKENYSTDVRSRIEQLLMDAFSGESVESKVLINESALARLQCRISTPSSGKKRINLVRIEKNIADAVRTWQGGLREELVKRLGHEQAARLFDKYGNCFSAAYQEDFTPAEATFEVERIAKIDEGDDIQMALYRPTAFGEDHLRFQIVQKDQPIPISDVLPMLENMGLKVISERPYRCRLEQDRSIYVQEFEMLAPEGYTINPTDISQRFQDTFENTWRGYSESDGFNTLVVTAGLNWREVAVLRAYCRYLMQAGLPFSQTYMEEVFRHSPKFAKMWMALFEKKFDPHTNTRRAKNDFKAPIRALKKFIETVKSADEDRIFSSFLAALLATLRTNFYQKDDSGQHKHYVSFKFNPADIPGLPKPLPLYEIFVYSSRMEGVHLRGGSVARGGIRWSDRREDFRTEILGLMKAQIVKNTVIVPTGAKGGFVCKKILQTNRESIQQEVIKCYSTLIFGMLDITDNIVNEKIVPPSDVVRHDEDDPYLVVAADKGTASFSDIANGIANDYGFWLGDAFASGGSVGYDHKGMGITAKGGWEAVKRHFRELGIDTQTQEFTVAGIGDMGGDVFGNGMLRSSTMKLLAAFNHLHIFLDPDPDPAKSFKERARLFALPRSSWEDYNQSLISMGGGVYPRSAKSISLSKEAKAMLNLDEKTNEHAPNEIIKAILKMQVDLLWNGGIGTYIKGSGESHEDAGDRSNNSVRVNGNELLCRVIGEGGNLGLTQLGRVEYALNDGKVNTDFIDNAGGVDCSDREVNIKILLNLAMNQANLNTKQRNRLLEQMTDEVEELVLQDNYFQTQAISTLESDARNRANEHLSFIRMLEQSGELDRELEFLPSDAEVLERRKNGKGLTRPELSILLSYSKINLINQLATSDELDNDFALEDLRHYFPAPLQKKYAKLMPSHRLAAEIIATQTANGLVNRMGPTYVVRTQEETGATAGEIARVYTIARETLDLRPVWRSVEALDNKVQAKAQYRMLAETARLMRRASIWLLIRPQFSTDTAKAIEIFRPTMSNLSKNLGNLLNGPSLENYKESTEIYAGMGVSKSLAQKMAGIRFLYSGYDIAQTSQQTNIDDQEVAKIYFSLARGLNVGWLHEQIEGLAVRGRWQALARGTLRENLYEIQRAATVNAIKSSKDRNATKVIQNWLTQNKAAISRAELVISDMRSVGSMDFATLSVAIQELRKLILL